MHRFRRACFAAALAVLIAATQSAAQQAQPSAFLRAPAFTAAQLSALPTTGWLTNGGNSPTSAIPPWTRSPHQRCDAQGPLGARAAARVRARAFGPGSAHRPQRRGLHHHGDSDVFALDAASGSILWRHEARLDANRVRVCCGWVNRGVALGDGDLSRSARCAARGARPAHGKWCGRYRLKIPAGLQHRECPALLRWHGDHRFRWRRNGHARRIKAYDARTGTLRWTSTRFPLRVSRGRHLACGQ